MSDPIARHRPPPITRSAFVCGGISVLLIAIVAQASLSGEEVGSAGIGTLVVGTAGLVCTFMLLTLNRFARIGFVAFWLILLGAAIYSWAFLRPTRDYGALIGVIALAGCGVVLWRTIRQSWPRRSD